LVGIAKLASQGESLREGHAVEYFTLPARSLLNRCVSGRGLPFTWTINPYRGCEFACKYCYARYTHEFMEMRNGVDFEQKIYVKQHTAELLRHDLRRVKPGEPIALGTATDPYQPAERRYEITRGILQEFARHRGFELGIVTKSNLVLRDIDLLREVALHNRLSIHITVTTMNVELARILEPRAPRPDLRIDAVRHLSEAGINVGVSSSPVLPGITDSPADLEAVVRAAAEAGARHTPFFTDQGPQPSVSRCSLSGSAVSWCQTTSQFDLGDFVEQGCTIGECRGAQHGASEPNHLRLLSKFCDGLQTQRMAYACPAAARSCRRYFIDQSVDFIA
jgi:DNA repair photolyase